MSRAARLRAGKLDRHISIERRREEIDAFGSPIETWIGLGKFPAELVFEMRGDAMTSQEIRQGGEVLAIERVFTFRTRWIERLTVADRLIYDGKPFTIIGVAEIPRRRGWEIKARHRGY